ncbi:MAG: FlgD immunoglobulin-like domain containing protein [Candidatus Cloacimonetes bacterium]|nr:FlgD immunoglobulin-like domain containing protein [Candidatus Cloacimonadota bacterium]
MKIAVILAICFMTGFLFAQDFNARTGVGLISNAIITEASGLAASQKNAGIIWIHNDSGANAIYAMSTTGAHVATYTLSGIAIRDLEDIAIGPGPVPGEHYIYLADIGDNDGDNLDKYIYRFIEPVVTPGEGTITGIETITFQYPSPNNYDAETLMVDPLTKDIYVVTKGNSSTPSDQVFYAPYPQSTTETIEMTSSVTLSIPPFQNPINSQWHGATGGDISFNGREILIRTYNNVFYWSRAIGQSIGTALSAAHYICPYNMTDIPYEPQGEAVCWDAEARGYYTTSEEEPSPLPPYNIIPPYLSYTSRNDDTLPVELSSFDYTITSGNFVSINWATSSETDLYGFNVYRNTEPLIPVFSLNFGIINANGISSQGSVYSFTDENALPETTYYYWLESVDNDITSQFFGPITVFFQIEEDDEGTSPIPESTQLLGNYPNPFSFSDSQMRQKNGNPGITRFCFVLAKESSVELEIFDIKGKKVRTLINETKPAGFYEIPWQGEDNCGQKCSTGIYFYRLRTDNYNRVNKLLLID